MIRTTDLSDLIQALEDGGRSDGRGLRISSYTSLFTAKAARLAIIEQLKRLEEILEEDHLGDDQ